MLHPMVLYADKSIVVVDKPPGWTTSRDARDIDEFGQRTLLYLPKTLAEELPHLLHREGYGRPNRVFPVHRLDRDTSGLVVFALTAAAEQNLGKQFRKHSAKRKYLGIVRGTANPGRIETTLVDDRGDGRRGSAVNQAGGKPAITHVTVLRKWEGFTLVECELETGRTHQIRIHLAEAGTPLCGETLYDRPLHGKPLPDSSGAKRIALHAFSLELEHPDSKRRSRWQANPPNDIRELIERFRTECDQQEEHYAKS